MHARSRGLAAVALAAVAGAAALPITSVGIGWPIAALAIAGVVLATRETQGSPESQALAERQGLAEGQALPRGQGERHVDLSLIHI